MAVTLPLLAKVIGSGADVFYSGVGGSRQLGFFPTWRPFEAAEGAAKTQQSSQEQLMRCGWSQYLPPAVQRHPQGAQATRSLVNRVSKQGMTHQPGHGASVRAWCIGQGMAHQSCVMVWQFAQQFK